MEKWNKNSITRFHEEYEGSYAGDTSSTEIIRLSKKYIGNRVLDVGAGSGALINRLPSAVGIDLVPKHPKVIKEDISNMSFNDESFDTIFATEILEHLDDVIAVLRECHRLLKSNGKLHIKVVYWNHKFSYSDPTHKHYFSEIAFEFFVGKWRPYYTDFKFADLEIDYIFEPNAVRKFGKNKKRLLKKAYFLCNIIRGMNITYTK